MICKHCGMQLKLDADDTCCPNCNEELTEDEIFQVLYPGLEEEIEYDEEYLDFEEDLEDNLDLWDDPEYNDDEEY